MSLKSGIVVVDKPIGLSSNTVVNKIKSITSANKAGHLGTLDVLGDGVLLVTLNKATRLFDYFLTKQKTYKACFCFGFETDTLDSEGDITDCNYRKVERSELEKVLQQFKGKISQLPPQYSALKVDGKTAYDIARSGGVAEIKPRDVEIFDIKICDDISQLKRENLINVFNKYNRGKINLDFSNHQNDQIEKIKKSILNNIFEFEITCSAGTYIRSLCRDIAKEISMCSTMLCITRTTCGNFFIKQAKTIDEIKNGDFDVFDVEKIIDLPIVKISKDDGKKLLDGKEVFYEPILNSDFKLYADDKFFGIANNENNEKVYVKTYLREDK